MSSLWRTVLTALGFSRPDPAAESPPVVPAAAGPYRAQLAVTAANDDSDDASASDAAAPPWRVPAEHTRVVEIDDGRRVEIDVASQVLRVDVPEPVVLEAPPDDDEPAQHGGRARRPARTAAAASDRVQPELAPAPGLAAGPGRGRDVFVTAAMLGVKARQFDQGLLAATELALDRGTADLPGFSALVTGLLRALEAPAGDGAVTDGEPDIAREIVLAAAQLGGIAPTAPRPDRAARARATAFEREDGRARPVGLYAWTDELGALFRRDQMLATLDATACGDGDPARLASIARALHAEPALRASYERHLALREKLACALDAPDLRPALAALDGAPADTGAAPDAPPAPLAADTALFPATATSLEARLRARVLPDPRAPAPRGFDLASAASDALRTRALVLAPDARSGWYDAQLWALEPLLAPARTREAARVRFSSAYRAALVELFKTLAGLPRESHLARRELAARRSAAARPDEVRVAPALRVEPLAEHFLRRAVGYRFVRELLARALGRKALAAMRGLGPDGPREAPLARELAQIEALFYGAHVVARQDLGLAPLSPSRVGSGDPARDAAAFVRWTRRLARDADLGADTRVMVPLAHDPARGRTRVWALLGWTSRPLAIAFAQPPALRVLDPAGRDVTAATRVRLVPQREQLHYPVTAELELARVPDREQFRRLCDRHKTRAAILAQLTGRLGR